VRYREISFDDELNRGLASYGGVLGQWWSGQAANRAHRYAYANIANFIRDSFATPFEHIVDYACGQGDLLARLAQGFPDARLTGFDGSPLLLEFAARKIARLGQGTVRRTRLVETPLPNFDLPGPAADLVAFSFPNIVPSANGGDFAADERRLSATDRAILRELSQTPGPGESASYDPAGDYAILVRDRLVSLNIRYMLNPGGICIRVEYTNVAREGLPKLELIRTGMEEGSIRDPVFGKEPACWFQVVASRYFRSAVMEDVYHQSGEECDKTGGYMITVLRAI
jgi:SAM-dependent methyltransferase